MLIIMIVLFLLTALLLSKIILPFITEGDREYWEAYGYLGLKGLLLLAGRVVLMLTSAGSLFCIASCISVLLSTGNLRSLLPAAGALVCICVIILIEWIAARLVHSAVPGKQTPQKNRTSTETNRVSRRFQIFLMLVFLVLGTVCVLFGTMMTQWSLLIIMSGEVFGLAGIGFGLISLVLGLYSYVKMMNRD